MMMLHGGAPLSGFGPACLQAWLAEMSRCLGGRRKDWARRWHDCRSSPRPSLPLRRLGRPLAVRLRSRASMASFPPPNLFGKRMWVFSGLGTGGGAPECRRTSQRLGGRPLGRREETQVSADLLSAFGRVRLQQQLAPHRPHEAECPPLDTGRLTDRCEMRKHLPPIGRTSIDTRAAARPRPGCSGKAVRKETSRFVRPSECEGRTLTIPTAGVTPGDGPRVTGTCLV